VEELGRDGEVAVHRGRGEVLLTFPEVDHQRVGLGYFGPCDTGDVAARTALHRCPVERREQLLAPVVGMAGKRNVLKTLAE